MRWHPPSIHKMRIGIIAVFAWFPWLSQNLMLDHDFGGIPNGLASVLRSFLGPSRHWWYIAPLVKSPKILGLLPFSRSQLPISCIHVLPHVLNIAHHIPTSWFVFLVDLMFVYITCRFSLNPIRKSWSIPTVP